MRPIQQSCVLKLHESVICTGKLDPECISLLFFLLPLPSNFAYPHERVGSVDTPALNPPPKKKLSFDTAEKGSNSTNLADIRAQFSEFLVF